MDHLRFPLGLLSRLCDALRSAERASMSSDLR